MHQPETHLPLTTTSKYVGVRLIHCIYEFAKLLAHQIYAAFPGFPLLWRSTIAKYSPALVSAARAQTIAVSQSTNAWPRLTPDRRLSSSNFLKSAGVCE